MADEWEVRFPVHPDKPCSYTLPASHPIRSNDDEPLLRLRFANGKLFHDGEVSTHSMRTGVVNISSTPESMLPGPPEFNASQDMTNTASISKPSLATHDTSLRTTRKRVSFYGIPSTSQRSSSSTRTRSSIHSKDTLVMETRAKKAEKGKDRLQPIVPASESSEFVGPSGTGMTAIDLNDAPHISTAPQDNAARKSLEPQKWKLRNKNHEARWFSSQGVAAISAPVNIDLSVSLAQGDLYVHRILDRAASTFQVWVFLLREGCLVWVPVRQPRSIRHPIFPELLLVFSGNKGSEVPGWITESTARRKRDDYVFHVNA
ncbi:hypothetical protein C8Q74DRAFT_1305416 [Fomes fomentarius]|nr:hypothetical protein C8Q74DRAFT_1305156 [Fomes fomentarius]KAI0755792.1 hypothetical protein C8Q74DRAFT_1305416 [Fomes fomentarius]